MSRKQTKPAAELPESALSAMVIYRWCERAELHGITSEKQSNALLAAGYAPEDFPGLMNGDRLKRLMNDPVERGRCQLIWSAAEQILIDRIRSGPKKASYEVHHELEVCREAFLLHYGRGGDYAGARQAALLRSDVFGPAPDHGDGPALFGNEVQLQHGLILELHENLCAAPAGRPARAWYLSFDRPAEPLRALANSVLEFSRDYGGIDGENFVGDLADHIAAAFPVRPEDPVSIAGSLTAYLRKAGIPQEPDPTTSPHI